MADRPAVPKKTPVTTSNSTLKALPKPPTRKPLPQVPPTTPTPPTAPNVRVIGSLPNGDAVVDSVIESKDNVQSAGSGSPSATARRDTVFESSPSFAPPLPDADVDSDSDEPMVVWRADAVGVEETADVLAAPAADNALPALPEPGVGRPLSDLIVRMCCSFVHFSQPTSFAERTAVARATGRCTERLARIGESSFGRRIAIWRFIGTQPLCL